MSEQTVCWNLLQDQRKSIVEMYIFNMTVLAKVVLTDANDVEEFVDGARGGVLVHNGFMKGYIRGVEEKYPHVAIPAYDDWPEGSQKCKHCGSGLGWKCPDNPNGYCVYDYERTGQDREWCIHCGAPEERK